MTANLKHENIVEFIGASAAPMAIVTEWVGRGSLYDIIHKAPELIRDDWPRRIDLMLGVARGMAYLHSQDIMHRDLKSGNVLVTQNWVVKIADFGLSRAVALSMTRRIGTTRFCAAEVLDGQRYTTKADVYSYGILCWELCAFAIPFPNENFSYRVETLVIAGQRPKIPSDTPESVQKLIEMCWHQNPNERPNFVEIVQYILKLVDDE